MLPQRNTLAKLNRYLSSWSVLLALLTLLCPSLPAGAEAGSDITADCVITLQYSIDQRPFLFDNNYRTLWEYMGGAPATITVTPPEGTRQGGLYLCFAREPASLLIMQEDITLCREEGQLFAHRYIPFTGEGQLSILLRGDGRGVSISELRIFTGEEPPEWVQRWQPPRERADLLLLVAHPDDELLWMGGAVPYYALERKMRVVVSYMTCANPLRRSELLNGLWAAGIHHYPYFGMFEDRCGHDIRESLAIWGGEERVNGYITGLYRMLKPLVILTHDFKGEYGHPAHVITARAAVKALDLADDPTAFSDNAQRYGTWSVPKAYVHLFSDNTLDIPWQQPIALRDNKTALQVCMDAFAMHRSANPVYRVDVDGPYAPTRFGLYRSLVGPDVSRDDFFENIDMMEETANRGAGLAPNQ